MSSTFRNRSASAGRKSEVCEPARPSGQVSSLDAHLGYWLRFVSNHVSRAFEGKVARHGVTVAEWVVLRALFDADGIKPSELSETIGLTRGAISKLLDRLATKNLVAIRSDTADRRAQIVTLTPPGRRLVPTLATLADENDAETFSHLDPKQRATLLATLQTLVHHLGLRGSPID